MRNEGETSADLEQPAKVYDIRAQNLLLKGMNDNIMLLLTQQKDFVTKEQLEAKFKSENLSLKAVFGWKINFIWSAAATCAGAAVIVLIGIAVNSIFK